MSGTAWMKEKDARQKILSEYQRLRSMTAARMVAEIYPKVGNEVLSKVLTRLYRDTSCENYETTQNHDLENTILFDFAIFLNEEGVEENPRQEFVRRYANAEEASLREMAQLLAGYRYTILRPVKARKGFGVKCVDLLAQEEIVLVDVGASETLREGCGLIIGTGLLPIGDPCMKCYMNTGAMIPVQDIMSSRDVDFLLSDMKVARPRPLVLDDAEMPMLASIMFKLALEGRTLSCVHVA